VGGTQRPANVGDTADGKTAAPSTQTGREVSLNGKLASLSQPWLMPLHLARGGAWREAIPDVSMAAFGVYRYAYWIRSSRTCGRSPQRGCVFRAMPIGIPGWWWSPSARNADQFLAFPGMAIGIPEW